MKMSIKKKEKSLTAQYSSQVHSFFILLNTGICIYSRDFTKRLKKVDTYLLSALLSALFSFSKELTSKQLDAIEMFDLKLAFKRKDKFIFVIISDETVSQIFLFDCLETISSHFLYFYEKLGPSRDYEVIKDKKVDLIIDSIAKGLIDPLFYRSPQKIENYFKNLIMDNEIIGAAMLSITGRIYYSSLPKKILINSLKELENISKEVLNEVYEVYEVLEKRRSVKTIREIIKRGYPKVSISVLKNGQKIFSKQVSHKKLLSRNYIIIILYDSKVKLGIAELSLMKIAKNIKKLL
ncbi:MAG: hypothetical protein EU529_12125 [Promethearchaeota archaeon]|nr:MAG: hypothetical protein EU529_12125 [Candidatus Lokiarchaeota archaeon]